VERWGFVFGHVEAAYGELALGGLAVEQDGEQPAVDPFEVLPGHIDDRDRQGTVAVGGRGDPYAVAGSVLDRVGDALAGDEPRGRLDDGSDRLLRTVWTSTTPPGRARSVNVAPRALVANAGG
jgi:hypothetical protein